MEGRPLGKVMKCQPVSSVPETSQARFLKTISALEKLACRQHSLAVAQSVLSLAWPPALCLSSHDRHSGADKPLHRCTNQGQVGRSSCYVPGSFGVLCLLWELT